MDPKPLDPPEGFTGLSRPPSAGEVVPRRVSAPPTASPETETSDTTGHRPQRRDQRSNPASRKTLVRVVSAAVIAVISATAVVALAQGGNSTSSQTTNEDQPIAATASVAGTANPVPAPASTVQAKTVTSVPRQASSSLPKAPSEAPATTRPSLASRPPQTTSAPPSASPPSSSTAAAPSTSTPMETSVAVSSTQPQQATTTTIRRTVETSTPEPPETTLPPCGPNSDVDFALTQRSTLIGPDRAQPPQWPDQTVLEWRISPIVRIYNGTKGTLNIELKFTIQGTMPYWDTMSAFWTQWVRLKPAETWERDVGDVKVWAQTEPVIGFGNVTIIQTRVGDLYYSCI